MITERLLTQICRKSRLARKSALSFKAQYPATSLFCIDASNEDSSGQGLFGLATIANIMPGGSEDLASLVEVKTYLIATARQNLMIFDGLDDGEALFGKQRLVKVLPTASSSRVLFTSQDKRVLYQLVGMENLILLNGLSPEEPSNSFGAKSIATASIKKSWEIF